MRQQFMGANQFLREKAEESSLDAWTARDADQATCEGLTGIDRTTATGSTLWAALLSPSVFAG